MVASQDELHAPFGGVVPEVASRRHLELVVPVIREALADAGADARRRRRDRRHRRARADRRAARRRVGGEGARLVAAAAADPGRPSARPCRVALPPSRSTSSRRSPACSRAAGTRCCSTCSERGGVPRARDDARRCGGRGVRQGRAAARARLSGREGDRRARARRATRARMPFRSRACPDSTSRSRVSRRRCSTPSATSRRPSSRRGAPIWPPSYQRAIVRALVERLHATGAERIAVVGGVAANSELRAALPDATLAPLAALHRQRRDDRLGGPVSPARPVPRVPFARCAGRLERSALIVVVAAIAAALIATISARGREPASATSAAKLARPCRRPARPGAERAALDRRPAHAVTRPAARAGRATRPRRASVPGRHRPPRHSKRY